MAEKSLRESSENPANIPQSQAAAQAYSAAHTPTNIDPSTAASEAEALLGGSEEAEPQTPEALPEVPPMTPAEKDQLAAGMLNIDNEPEVETEFEAWVLGQVTASNEVEDFASAVEQSLIKKLKDEGINLTQSGLKELTRITSQLVLEGSKSDLAREGIVTGLANNVSSMGDMIGWLGKWITKPFSSDQSAYFADYSEKRGQIYF